MKKKEIGQKEIMEYIKNLDSAKVNREFGIDPVLDLLSMLKIEEDDEAVERLNNFLNSSETRFNLLEVKDSGDKEFTTVIRIPEGNKKSSEVFGLIKSNNVVALELTLAIEYGPSIGNVMVSNSPIKDNDESSKKKNKGNDNMDDILRDILGDD